VEGIRRRFGRGSIDHSGSDRSRRSGACNHTFIARAIEIAPGRFILGKSDCRSAQRIRRSRGKEGMTIPRVMPVAGKSVPTSHMRDHTDPCTAVVMGAGGDLMRRKLMPSIYVLA